MHKKYHNHSGLELSNGLYCYGSQKLRQLRVRVYSTSNLVQTTIAYIMHVICNLIQALKSERITSSHVARKVTQNTRPHMWEDLGMKLVSMHYFTTYTPAGPSIATRALPGLFWIMRIHITRTGCEDTFSPAYSICVHRCTYGVQCSDKIHFPQLCIKCGIAKSCPGTHTALQAPMFYNRNETTK